MKDLIDRADALMYLNSIRYVVFMCGSQHDALQIIKKAIKCIQDLPSAEPERLTDDDFETIRIHLNAYKEKLCNQHRWKEAEEYQRIIDRFMAFASAQPKRKIGKWIEKEVIHGEDAQDITEEWQSCKCSVCGRYDTRPYLYYFIEPNYCSWCGAEIREDKHE